MMRPEVEGRIKFLKKLKYIQGGKYVELINLLCEVLQQDNPQIQLLLRSRHFVQLGEFYKSSAVDCFQKDLITETMLDLSQQSLSGYELLCYPHCNSVLVAAIECCSTSIATKAFSIAREIAKKTLEISSPSEEKPSVMAMSSRKSSKKLELQDLHLCAKKKTCKDRASPEDFWGSSSLLYPLEETIDRQREILGLINRLDEEEKHLCALVGSKGQEMFAEDISRRLGQVEDRRCSYAKEFIQLFNNKFYRRIWEQWMMQKSKQEIKGEQQLLTMELLSGCGQISYNGIAIETEMFDVCVSVKSLPEKNTSVIVWLLVRKGYRLLMGVGVSTDEDVAKRRSEVHAMRLFIFIQEMFAKGSPISSKVWGFFRTVAAEVISRRWKNFHLTPGHVNWDLEETLVINNSATSLSNPWAVLISEDALRKLQRLKHWLPLVMKSLKHLWKGQWSKLKLTDLNDGLDQVSLYQIQLQSLMVIWQVDTMYLHDVRSDSQVIKIWEVTGPEGVLGCKKRVAMVHKYYTLEHVRRCQTHSVDISGMLDVPAVFSSSVPMYDFRENSMSESDLQDLANTMLSLKFIRISIEVLSSIRLGIKAEFPFQLSKEEYQVIEEPRSIILLGRSGTGKTTCLLFRMLILYVRGRFEMKKLYPSLDATSLKFENKKASRFQLFVTASPILCERVRRYFVKLKTAAIDLQDLKRSQIMLQEDNLECEENMIEEEDEEKMLASIPDDFTELQATNFPLFITYKKFLCMLLGTIARSHKSIKQQRMDMGDGDYKNEMKEGKHQALENPEKFPENMSECELTYERFENYYWKKIDERQTRHQSPSLVWAEIMSLIKGSEQALETASGHLSKQQYANCSYRCFPNFQHNREILYSIFEQYENIKRLSGHHDVMDTVYWVYSAIRKHGYNGHLIDEVYCDEVQVQNICIYIKKLSFEGLRNKCLEMLDEVQDLSVSQLMLLQTLCNNPKGLFLAGDTAQTIARGAAFRFEEVNSMIYRCNQQGSAVRQNAGVPAAPIPRSIQLTTSFRSHAGILRLASSIVDLIECYFKGSIDSLEQDAMMVEGPKPVFLEVDQKSLAFYLEGDKESKEPIEFGAEQVILVRNEISKKELQDAFGAALTMTIYEAKGMEFNDVLVYNFFRDSPANLKWRAMLDSVKGDVTEPYPQFDPTKHNILCSELKHLYTAVTRARKVLWFYDSSENRIPMLKYWKSLHLLQVACSEGENRKLMPLARKSSKDEWIKKGVVYFEQRLYEQAKFCFVRAGTDEKVKLCEANITRKRAQISLDTGNLSTGKRLFLEAAEIFKSLQRKQAAISCLLSGENFIEAGELLKSERDFYRAKDAFVRGNDYCRAAECMESTGNNTEAVKLYKEGGILDRAIDRMQDSRYRATVDPRIVSRTIQMFCLPILHKAQTTKSIDFDRGIAKALSLLPTQQAKEKFLVDHGCVGSLVKIYCTKQNYEKAANLYFEHGQRKEAADLYIKAVESFTKDLSNFNQKVFKALVESAMDCQVLSLRENIASLKPGVLPYSLGGGVEIVDEEDSIKNLCEKYTSSIMRLKKIYNQHNVGHQGLWLQKFRGIIPVDTSDANDWYVLAIQELVAQINGDVEVLHDYLQRYTDSPENGRFDCQLRVLLILCNSYRNGRITLDWSIMTEYRRLLMNIAEKLLSTRIIDTDSAVLESYERFFVMKPYGDRESYLITEDPINYDLTQLLEQWQSEDTSRGEVVIQDETPVMSTVRMWRCSRLKSQEAMRVIILKQVLDILQFGAHQGRAEVEKQDFCKRSISFGSCSRMPCRFRHLDSPLTMPIYRRFLSQILIESSLSSFQVYISKKIAEHLAEDGVNVAMKLNRHWLEKLQENLQLRSSLLSCSVINSEIVRSKEFPKGQLIDLMCNVWIKKEYSHEDVTSVLKILYIHMQLGLRNVPLPIVHALFSSVIIYGRSYNVGLIMDHRTSVIRPVHSWLLDMLGSMNQGPGTFFFVTGMRYVRFIVNPSNKLFLEKPWSLIWLLEVLAGVIIAMKCQFQNVVLPSSVIYSFFLGQNNFCRRILSGRPSTYNFSEQLFNLCILVRRFWDVGVKYSDERWGGTLRLQTILVVSCCHLQGEIRSNVWEAGILVMNEQFMKAPKTMDAFKVKNVSSFESFYLSISEALEDSLEPLVKIRLANSSEATTWYCNAIKKALEIDLNGSLKDPTLHPNSEQKIMEERSIAEDKHEEHPSFREEEDYDVTEGIEKVTSRQKEAVCFLQAWFRKKAKSKAYKRDHNWDDFFKRSISIVSNKLSSGRNLACERRYRMFFLGQVLPITYYLDCMKKKLDYEIKDLRRNVLQGPQKDRSCTEFMLDRIDILSDARDDADAHLSRMSVEEEYHLHANVDLLKKVYEGGVEILKRCRALLLQGSKRRMIFAM